MTTMETVKAAISIRKPLFEKADRTARELRISRSRLYSDALEDYLKRRESREILDSWNAAYTDEAFEEDKPLLDAASRTVVEIADEW